MNSALGILIATLFLIVEVMIAFACYKLAVKKNRNYVIWFVLGIFFPIPALLVLLLLKPVSKPEEEQSTSSSKM